jgi:hypothetical protein
MERRQRGEKDENRVSAAAGGDRNLELFVEMAMVASVDLGRSYFFP